MFRSSFLHDGNYDRLDAFDEAETFQHDGCDPTAAGGEDLKR